VTALTDELRRRLDVPVDMVPDPLLESVLQVAGTMLAPWLVPPDQQEFLLPNIREATVQLAVKMWDVQGRGATTMDAVGEFLTPAPTASPGMIRSVFGVLGPALNLGGVSV